MSRGSRAHGRVVGLSRGADGEVLGFLAESLYLVFMPVCQELMGPLESRAGSSGFQLRVWFPGFDLALTGVVVGTSAILGIRHFEWPLSRPAQSFRPFVLYNGIGGIDPVLATSC